MEKKSVKTSKISKLSCVLVFMSTMWMSLGAYYNYNFPQLFEDILIKTFEITPVEVEFLYTLYSLPNYILTPIGSWLLSYTGLGLGILLFDSPNFFGPLIIYIGFYFKKYWVVEVGKCIYGMGAELCTVAQSTISDQWFSGKALSISLAMNRTFGFVGDSISAYFGPKIFIKTRNMNMSLLLC